MQVTQAKKSKVNLNDYDYRKDIAHRIWLSDLSPIDIDVLREVVYGSIKTTISEVADLVDRSTEEIRPTLSKLSDYRLISCTHDKIKVSKEMRKDFEREIEKYEDNFRPGIPYLRTLLNKVPIHILPNWYSIPRMSDSIITSIIEKCLETPRAYRQYLAELSAENPTLTAIAEDVFAADDFKVRTNTLRERYELSREQLEEYALVLEFNLVCCISPILIDDEWVEMLTPFYEWGEYLRYIRDTAPVGFEETDAIQRRHSSNFGCIEDIEWILRQLRTAPAPRTQLQVASTAGQCEDFDHALSKLTQLEMVYEEGSDLHCTGEAEAWLLMNAFDKAMALYRHPLNELRSTGLPPALVADRNFRLTERALQRVLDTGWITFNAFMKSVMKPIGSAQPSKLERVRSGEWRYSLPKLDEVDRTLTHRIIFERLYEVGITTTGTINGKDCFSLTPFGKLALGQ